MTLTEVHDRPELLARLLGVPFADTTVQERTYARYGLYTARTLTAAEYVARRWAEYRNGLQADWQRSPANPWKAQTWGQFVAECLSKGLGVKGRGKLAERIEYARIARPDLYGVAADARTMAECAA